MIRITKKILYYLLFLSCFTSLAGQEEKPEPPPPSTVIEPADLSPGWWNSLISDNKNLKKAIEEIIKKVEPYPGKLSEENRSKASSFVDEIKLNLNAYAKVIEQPLPEKEPPPPIADSYTIEDLIELNNTYIKNVIELEGRKDEREEFKDSVKNLRNRIDLVRQNYLAAKERSEEKILYGLETISLLPALDVAEAKLKLTNQNIANETEHLKALSDEIDQAKERLVSDTYEMRMLSTQMQRQLSDWERAKKKRQQIEAQLAGKYSDKPTEEDKISNENLSIQQIQADLEEIKSHNRYIKTEILFTISQMLNEPEAIDVNQLQEKLKEWSTQLATFTPSLNEWEAQSDRIVNRSAQLLSLDEKKPTLQSENIRQTLRRNVDLGQKNILEIQRLKKEVEESLFLNSVADEKMAIFLGGGERWLRITMDFIYDLLLALREGMGKTLFTLGDHPVTPAAILQFIFIMLIAWWLSKVLVAALNTFASTRKGVRKAVIYRINTLFSYFILFVGLLVALTSIGFDFSNLLIIAGALGIGIGFGLQNIFNDFISGIIILFQSHLKVGDFVVIDTDLRGEIREINVRSTIITTNDGTDVLVPNSVLISSRIINWTLRDPYRRMHIPFGVAYESDIDEVAKVVTQAAKKVPSTLEKIGVPEPQVFLKSFGDNALEMELVVWVDEKWTRRHRKTLSLYLWSIQKALKKNGITIPFPQRDLHVKSGLDVEALSKTYGVRPGDQIKPE